ncbi:hypothetical protein G7077_07465 [Sphingomonas piscis]|uniref:Uncharacterized protein n=1 Tax=Sphingomonas piscis TaxID=2714943 RepID=A0A6G7YPT3_9SPHN|nr:hypothetical protein [Sphingomonas piscis]QIK78758.1 hypothetical protein G7077_07465 [Sphingomonas piscis]
MARTEQDEYFQRRAIQERVAAKLASDERAARSHSRMAERYGSMAEDPTPSGSADEDPGPVLKSEFRIIP